MPVWANLGKVQCWFEFCYFGVRFSVYYLTFCFEVYNHHILKTKQQKNICIEEKVIIQINFNPGLRLAGLRTILPDFQQVNMTWARDPIEKPVLGQRSTSKKHVTSMSCTLEPAIWSRDTGQQIPCFDRCQLIITWMSNIKEVNGKPRLHVSVNLLLGVWPPSCATPSSSSSSSCVRAHEQYR